jgi:Cu2+-exporting ATPase
MRDSRLLVRPIGPGRFAVRNTDWFGPRGLSADFLRVTLAAPDVRWVLLDSDRCEAEVDHVPGQLRKVASVYRLRPGDLPELPPDLLDPPGLPVHRRQFFRYGRLVSDWVRQHEQPGLLRLQHPGLRGRTAVWDAVSGHLESLMGVKVFRLDSIGGSLTVRFDPVLVHPQQLVHALHQAVRDAPGHARSLLHRVDLPAATTSLAASGLATFALPELLLASAGLMLATAVPSYRRAVRLVTRERRLSVDVLDSIIFTTCLFTGQIFAGAMTAFFLSVGRTLLRRTRAQSERLLVEAFERQPSIVRLERRDGSTAEVPVEQVQAGDIILVHTGEAVPVDGTVPAIPNRAGDEFGMTAMRAVRRKGR